MNFYAKRPLTELEKAQIALIDAGHRPTFSGTDMKSTELEKDVIAIPELTELEKAQIAAIDAIRDREMARLGARHGRMIRRWFHRWLPTILPLLVLFAMWLWGRS